MPCTLLTLGHDIVQLDFSPIRLNLFQVQLENGPRAGAKGELVTLLAPDEAFCDEVLSANVLSLQTVLARNDHIQWDLLLVRSLSGREKTESTGPDCADSRDDRQAGAKGQNVLPSLVCRHQRASCLKSK